MDGHLGRQSLRPPWQLAGKMVVDAQGSDLDSRGVQNEGNAADAAAKLPPSSTPDGPELASIAEANPVTEAGTVGLAQPSVDSGADDALRSLRCRPRLQLSTMTLSSVIPAVRHDLPRNPHGTRQPHLSALAG